ncbi:MAG: hypothetical protein ACFFDP_10290 [Promethearchaeota archaeon]
MVAMKEFHQSWRRLLLLTIFFFVMGPLLFSVGILVPFPTSCPDNDEIIFHDRISGLLTTTNPNITTNIGFCNYIQLENQLNNVYTIQIQDQNGTIHAYIPNFFNYSIDTHLEVTLWLDYYNYTLLILRETTDANISLIVRAEIKTPVLPCITPIYSIYNILFIFLGGIFIVLGTRTASKLYKLLEQY